jgi:hypothetical protein
MVAANSIAKFKNLLRRITKNKVRSGIACNCTDAKWPLRIQQHTKSPKRISAGPDICLHAFFLFIDLLFTLHSLSS